MESHRSPDHLRCPIAAALVLELQERKAAAVSTQHLADQFQYWLVEQQHWPLTRLLRRCWWHLQMGTNGELMFSVIAPNHQVLCELQSFEACFTAWATECNNRSSRLKVFCLRG
ncbi:hypothetical protein [Leptolyngbya sp. FACHB-261]|uniref:hypothetical protein n=1 Tax=Leptolyngbya sp. FACHB-261 TaxID=2692806 RepID=UPI001682AB10|nr:hypothetical protein [Leptolyngbya sp. FACHB-261]MBD2102035.1 hypothetical protein [Leptolyngbya sp. FACHB-261]